MAPRSRSRSKKSGRSRTSSLSMSSPTSSSSPSSMSPRSSGAMVGAQVFSSLIAIAINAYLLNYIMNLEKVNCECSKHWQRDYIKYFSIVVIALSVLMIITTLSGLVATGPLAGLLFFIRAVMLIASLANIFILFHYSTSLKTKECECSEDIARTFMTYYSGLIIVVFVIVLLYALIAGAVNASRV